MKRSLLVASLACAVFVVAGAPALAGCSGGSGDAAGTAPSVTDASVAVPVAVAADAGTGVIALPTEPNLITLPTGPNLITAQASGEVSGTPDVVTIVLGVETTDASARAALDRNNGLAADAIAAIKANGVADEDLRTSRLSISPRYDDTSTVTGYQVSNILTATLRDVGRAGELIDAVGASAGDAIRVQRISFSIDDDSGLRASARADAVRRAQAQAQQMADAAGVRLGGLHAITETPRSSTQTDPATDMAAAPTESVPVEVGSIELNVVVQVAYEIAQ